VKNPDAVAKLVAENIARQLEGRVSFRRAMKQSIQRSMRSGIKGIKTEVSGRLGGADIARAEHYSEGTVRKEQSHFIHSVQTSITVLQKLIQLTAKLA